MKNHSFRNMEGYHKHLAARFLKRKARLTKEQLRGVLASLGFNIGSLEVDVAHSGNMSRVYLTSELAIKIRDRKSASDDTWQFLANKIVSDHFFPKLPVVHVLTYDHFEKTDYEVLIMERAKGKLLIDNFIKLDEDLQKKLFGQILDICNKISSLTFKDWGNISDRDAYKNFADFLRAKINEYSQSIIDQEIASAKDISLIKDYFLDKVDIFSKEKVSYFTHTDINIANVLHVDDKISLLFDFDSAIKGPKLMMLPKLISSIDNMGEIVDGTHHYKTYRDKKFEYLYPILLEKLPDVFLDKDLVRKLNLILIYRGLRLVAKNRFERWNHIIIKDMIDCEIAKTNKLLSQTYYGQILKKMGL